MNFTFGRCKSSVHIEADIPNINAILTAMNVQHSIIVCDTNTAAFAETMKRGRSVPMCTLPSGEWAKEWRSVETILKTALESGLGRDGLFIAVGGGVISDLCGFAASVYKRGAAFAAVPTTLLGMVDAAVGGKTGFDLFDIKNFAGTFYPARHIYMPLAALRTLPPREWRSGLAELVKTAVIDDSIYKPAVRERLLALTPALRSMTAESGELEMIIDSAAPLIRQAVKVKGRIVEKDPEERGGGREILNLGHTFAHALESSAGLGRLSHGEAVAWGIVRACELGVELKLTPPERAETIRSVITALSYETRAPHPAMAGGGDFIRALSGDKKKKDSGFRFVVPARRGARIVTIDEGNLKRIRRIAGLT
ncbi:MAG: 3-dehydroquinate synthase [Spirochaetaceae bacterium]|jgi:3-dehydroquinate synthase|nr:3-dehydroquinate synthase [Spirochaetaceae bacterium]